MSPSRYIRLRRMQRVHRVLRHRSPETATISEVARDHGFSELGRFAAEYRKQYGELPSETLRNA
jgi:AraC-like DNA-binding protein